MLYATRSISPYENDEIIEKVLKKSRAEPVVAKISEENCEKTKFGVQILPDKSDFGPLYVSKLRVPEDE